MPGLRSRQAKGDSRQSTVVSRQSSVDSRGVAQVCQKFFHVRRKWRVKSHGLLFDGVMKGEAPCVKGLSLERNRSQFVGTEGVAHFADQRVSAQTCLDANLVTLACRQTDLDKAGR